MHWGLWELAFLPVCADHTPNTLLNVWDFICIYMNIKCLEMSGNPCRNGFQTLGQQPEQMWEKMRIVFFLSSELSSVWYLGLSWALRDALACSGAVILCVSPLFLTLNLSPSSSAACWESRGLFYTYVRDDVSSSEIQCLQYLIV